MNELIQKQLDAAIAESNSTTSIVHVQTETAYIHDVIDDLEERHNVMVDFAPLPDGSFDVWGWTDATPANQTAWRLTLTMKD